MVGTETLILAVTRLAVALALGAAIGIERQWHQKMAGLRTNALVALGAGGFVVFSALVGEGDPTRVAAQVVSGVGFLGAGILFREGSNVHGLNTAATLWCSAMVGTFAGAGYLAPSAAAAALVIVTNLLLRPLVRQLNAVLPSGGDTEHVYTLEIICAAHEEAHMRALLLHELTKTGVGLRKIESAHVDDGTKARVVALAVSPRHNDAAMESIIGRVSLEPTVSAAGWKLDLPPTDA